MKNNLEEEFTFIPRKEVRHNKHYQEKVIWAEQKMKARAASALKKAKRKVSNEING